MVFRALRVGISRTVIAASVALAMQTSMAAPLGSVDWGANPYTVTHTNEPIADVLSTMGALARTPVTVDVTQAAQQQAGSVSQAFTNARLQSAFQRLLNRYGLTANYNPTEKLITVDVDRSAETASQLFAPTNISVGQALRTVKRHRLNADGEIGRAHV